MTPQSSQKSISFVLALAFSFSVSTLPIQARSRSLPPPGDSGCQSCLSQAAGLFAANKLESAAALLRQWSRKCPGNAQLHLMLSTILVRLGAENASEAESEAALACQAQPDLPAAHFQYAMTLLNAGKFAQSSREFESVTRLNPASYESWSELADLYKRLHQDENAAGAAEKAACLEPGRQAAKLSVLANLKNSGQLDAARKELKRLMLESEAVPEFQQLLAREAVELGAYDEAVSACNDVVKAYPGSTAPLGCLALAQFLLRQYAEAESSTTKILTQSGANAEIFALRALSRLSQGKVSQAESDLKNAPANDGAPGAVLLAHGLLKMNQGDFENAHDLLKFAGQSGAKSQICGSVSESLAHLALSRLNRKQGLCQDAIQEAHAAARDRRFFAAAYALEARALLLDGVRADAPAKAYELAQRALSFAEQEPEAILAMAFCQAAAGKFAQARDMATKAMQVLPADGDVNLVFAQIDSHESDLAGAGRELEKGLQIAPGDPELLYESGCLCLKNNKTAEAAQLLKQAAEAKIRSADTYFALAQALDKIGNAGESLKYYKQSLAQGLSGDSFNKARAAISRLESSN